VVKLPEKQALVSKTKNKRTTVKPKDKMKIPDAIPFPDPLTGDAMCAWRSSLGESRTAFADRLQFSVASVSQWENRGKETIKIQARTLSALRRAWEKRHLLS